MNSVPDWNQRKHEIGMAFRRCSHLPGEADAKAYEATLTQVGISSRRDLSILVSVVQDAVMMARREERPTAPLDTFADWLRLKLVE